MPLIAKLRRRLHAYAYPTPYSEWCQWACWNCRPPTPLMRLVRSFVKQ